MKNLKFAAAFILILTGCQATQLSQVTKDPTYDLRGMKNVLVVAAVKTDRVQKMLEDEFVRQLRNPNRSAVASYTLVSREQLSPESVKKLVNDNQCDTVIVSRLTEMKEEEKEFGGKFNNPNYASSYASYTSAALYQPSTYVREQTAFIETRVYDVASGRAVWSVRSKTEVAWGGDPVLQIRSFVGKLIDEAKKGK